MKRKLKILLISPLAAGAIVAANATRSDAFILDTLKGLWNQTTNIVTNTLDYYVGDYVSDLADHYIPRGIEKIAGALGLPDPGGMFQDIRDEAQQNKTENNDIAAGDLEESDVASGTGLSMGEAVLADDGQRVQKETSDASANIAKSSAEVAEKCQSSNISQEVMKCLAIQNANTAQLSKVQISQQQQILQQLAAGNVTNAKALKNANENARAKQDGHEQRGKEAISAVRIYSAGVDGLAQTGDSPK